MIVMMSPYEKTGRYNKIFYFKESRKLKIPNSLLINTDKGKMIGYGFYGANHLLDDTAATPPSFTPYSNCSSRIKNKSLYKSVMSNSIIDWREKDFTGVKKGSGITYVNDRDFLLEPDWEDLFNNFSNNISFIHSLRPQGRDQIKSILSKNYITSKICIPIDQLNIDDIKYCLRMNGAVFDITNITNEKLFSFIFLTKTFSSDKIKFSIYASPNPFTQKLLSWGMSGSTESFASFCGKDYDDTNKDYYRFKYRKLLRQKPSNMTPNEAIKELTF